MRNIKYLKYIIFILLVLSFTGCNKEFLDRPPLDKLTVAQFFKTDADLKAATGPLYGLLWYDYTDKFSYGYGSIMAGDIQTDGANYLFFNSISASSITGFGWDALYNIIVQADFTINNIRDNSGPNVSEAAKKAAYGEARLFRAIAYSYLIHIWGKGVPIIENPLELMKAPNKKRVVPEDVWTYLINDLIYAKNNLPETWSNADLGRVTKWSAEAYLAKMYLHHSGIAHSVGSRNQTDLDSAKFYAADILKNSDRALMGSYADIFKRENNNNSETLIALQYADNYNTWGAQNDRQAYLAPEGKITGAGDGWGAGNGASADLLKLFMSEPADLRRKACFMMNGDHYDELLKSQGGYDFSRPEICNIKKYVIGTSEDNEGHVGFMTTDICFYLMRLAELNLIYAEAIMGNNASTNDAEALKYFNEVRTRAGLSEKTSITFKDIFDEKRREFAMEDLQMFEYVRWSYFDPTAAIGELQAQGRTKAGFSGYSVEYNGPNNYNITYRPENNQAYTVTADNIYLPYPQTEIVQNPDLTADPVHFPYSK